MATPTSTSRTELGTTGLQLSRLGLGAWAMGGPWHRGWGPQSDADSIDAIKHAVASGVNWVDTAPAYGFGHSEAVVGRALKAIPERERPYVFTKCGLLWERGETEGRFVGDPASIRRECEMSLRRLGVEVIDLLQIHWPPRDGTPVEEAWGAVAQLVQEGKVRFGGVSNFSVEQLEACEAVHPVASLQARLSLIARTTAAELLPWCREHAAGVLLYSPLQSGLLSGAFTRERVAGLGDGDWRRTDPQFTDQLDRNLAFVAELRAVADRLGRTLPEVAIAWTLAWPGVTGAIVGGRTPAQIDGWIGAADLELDDEGRADIAAALVAHEVGEGPTTSPGEAA